MRHWPVWPPLWGRLVCPEIGAVQKPWWMGKAWTDDCRDGIVWVVVPFNLPVRWACSVWRWVRFKPPLHLTSKEWDRAFQQGRLTGYDYADREHRERVATQVRLRART